jgi:bromodomain adjacent to zinc finger domain protein 1A
MNGHNDRDELETGSNIDSEVASEMRGSSPPLSERDKKESLAAAGAARRQAMAQKALERSEAEAVRNARVKEERDEARAKKAEEKQVSAERKRLNEEDEAALKRLHELEYEFRSHIYTLRARPFGVDRFGNKLWWMDGLGSAPLTMATAAGEGSGSKSGSGQQVGTGRVYVQGVDGADLDWLIVQHEADKSQVEERRAREEGDGRLAPGEWGVYDTVEQVSRVPQRLHPC